MTDQDSAREAELTEAVDAASRAAGRMQVVSEAADRCLSLQRADLASAREALQRWRSDGPAPRSHSLTVRLPGMEHYRCRRCGRRGLPASAWDAECPGERGARVTE